MRAAHHVDPRCGRYRAKLTTPEPLRTLRRPQDQSVPCAKDISVANTKSAEKAARQADKHRAHNVALRSRMRSAIRKVQDAITSGSAEQARSSYSQALPMIDTLVNKGIIHRNKSNRHKSRLAARIKALSSTKT